MRSRWLGQAGSREEEVEFLADFFGDQVAQVGIKLLEVFCIQAAGYPRGKTHSTWTRALMEMRVRCCGWTPPFGTGKGNGLGPWAWLCMEGFELGAHGGVGAGLCQNLGLLTCMLFLVRPETQLTSASRSKGAPLCQKTKKWGL